LLRHGFIDDRVFEEAPCSCPYLRRQ
jgi:hypothetical protein